MLGGVLATGVVSSIAANGARSKNFTQAKIWSSVSASIALVLIALTLFLVVKGHTGAGEVTGALESLAVGVMISYVLLIVILTAVCSMNILALYESFKKDKDKALWYSIGSAIASFLGFIMALVLIIFLL